MNFYLEVAKMRAARLLWADAHEEDLFDPKKPQAR